MNWSLVVTGVGLGVLICRCVVARVPVKRRRARQRTEQVTYYEMDDGEIYEVTPSGVERLFEGIENVEFGPMTSCPPPPGQDDDL
jgi:hypothetical protein